MLIPMGTLKSQFSCTLKKSRLASLTHLISSPLHASHEQDHPGDAEETTNKINLADDLSAGETLGVGTRWRKVEEQGEEEANGSPDSAQKSTPSPSGVRCDQLGPQHGRTEGDDGKNEHGDVLATLGRGSQLGCHRQSRELIDTGSDARENHTTCPNH